jgi:hypothetical protein
MSPTAPKIRKSSFSSSSASPSLRNSIHGKVLEWGLTNANSGQVFISSVQHANAISTDTLSSEVTGPHWGTWRGFIYLDFWETEINLGSFWIEIILGAESGGNQELLWKTRATTTLHQSKGHKGPVLRPRCNGTERAQTQLLLYSLLTVWYDTRTTRVCSKILTVHCLEQTTAHIWIVLKTFVRPTTAAHAQNLTCFLASGGILNQGFWLHLHHS